MIDTMLLILYVAVGLGIFISAAAGCVICYCIGRAKGQIDEIKHDEKSTRERE